ncbi:MAG: 3-hydroxyacyl-CoA dehydrogenase NAD-binding domain-containing protein, partial [Longimicrobiales bacterium]
SALARELATTRRGGWSAGRSARIALENAAPARKLILWIARKQVLKETHGNYPAPLVALDTIDATLGASTIDDALALEADAVGRLITTDVSKNLLHVFFLMEAAKKKAPAAEPREVERVAVLGAGTMGGGIAQLLAYRGLYARLKDIDPAALSLGLRHARELFDGLRARRRLEGREATQAMERISPTLDYSGFGAVDLVVEAVVERLDVKKSVLRETEAAVDAETVMTTNTSSLSVSEMQRALERPDRFCGMHFFNPVHRMPLVEVVRGERSSDVTLATVFALARRLEKTPVIVADGPGFLVNRLLAPYLNEAGWLLADGASIEAIDNALTGFGMPMGPLRLLDEVGLDVARHAGETMHDAFGERMRPAPPLVALDASDRRGRKNGRGFYRYEKDRADGADDTIYAELQPTVPPTRAEISAQEIRDRTLLAMVNEAARVLEDGIVGTPDDVDLAMIAGTGFPPFRGGLLRWADARGLVPILELLDELQRRFGPRFEPAPLLREHASAGDGFYRRPNVAPASAPDSP